MNSKESNSLQLLVVGKEGKKEKKSNPNIELRCGEVQELMSKPPTAILKSGIAIIMVFVASFFALSFFIIYPEKMITTVKILPSVDVDYLSSPIDGHLIWMIKGMNTDVTKGDTLAIISHYPADTLYLISGFKGHAYKVDVLEKNINVKAGQRLFYISKKVNDEHAHKIYGVIYLPVDSTSVLRLGQITEVNYKGGAYPFVISEFGSVANEEGKYPISITYDDTLHLFTNIEPEYSIAKIQISNQTVFEKFFAKRLNILDKYKVNR